MIHSLTIGNFDGVHLGHQVLIQRVLELAQNHSQTAVLSFEPHPREFLGIRPIPERLCSVHEKERRIKKLGIDKFIVQEFNSDFANQNADEFLLWLSGQFKPKHIVVGNNFFFGKNRSGTPNVLKSWGDKHKIHVEIMEPLVRNGIVVSSTEIRIHVQNGNLKAANELCGFNFSLPMNIIHGDSRGRDLGFPTLNSAPPKLTDPAKYCLPPHGVYITQIRVEDESFPSITNFGTRPTFHNALAGEFFETHVLTKWEDRLSSKHLDVDFIDRIRPEQRFEDKSELIKRIQEDIRIARHSHGL